MANEEMTVKPPRSSVIAGWAMIVFGVLFALASLVAFFPDPGTTRNVSGGVMMLLFAGLVASIGIAVTTARAKAEASGLRYGYGLIRRYVSSTEIAAVTVGPGSGAYYPRLCVHVRRHHGKPLRLTAMQRPSTAKSRARLDAIAEELATILIREHR